MQNEIETEKLEKVLESKGNLRLRVIIDALVVSGILSLFCWAWNLSTDVAILKNSQIKLQDLKELKVEIKELLKENILPIVQINTDHENRIRAVERK